jgi:hypothetical protein
MRGRLIFPFVCELGRLDTVLTEAVDDGAGYDRVFREPVRVDDGTQLGCLARQETLVRFRAQIEPAMFDKMAMRPAGDVRATRFTIIAHYSELEVAGLVDPITGNAQLHVNDRFVAIYEANLAGKCVQRFPDMDGGLYLREVTPLGFGLGNKRNLLKLLFENRETAASGP